MSIYICFLGFNITLLKVNQSSLTDVKAKDKTAFPPEFDHLLKSVSPSVLSHMAFFLTNLSHFFLLHIHAVGLFKSDMHTVSIFMTPFSSLNSLFAFTL